MGRMTAPDDPSLLGALVHVSPVQGPMGALAAGKPTDASGRPWHAVRVLALSTTGAQAYLDGSRSGTIATPDGQAAVVCMPGGPGDPDVEILWAHCDAAVPIVQDPRAAAALAVHLLGSMRPGFAVGACICWIGTVRYYMEFAPAWPGSSAPVSVDEMPLAPGLSGTASASEPESN